MSFLDDIIDEERASHWIQQGTPEWDQARVGRFTSSEMWKLMVPPKGKDDKESGKLSETAMQYVSDKVAELFTGSPKVQGYGFPIAWGQQYEPEAIEYFCGQTEYIHEKVGFFPFHEHAGGSPDGIINDTDILEVKCPYDSGKQLDYLMLTDQYDLLRNFREHYWQCMSNLLFTKKEQCHFVTYDPRMIQPKHKMVHLIIKPISEHFDMLSAKIEVAVKEKLSLYNLLK